MIVVYGQDEIVGRWAGHALGAHINPPFVALGFHDGEQLRGAAIFNGWNHANIDITLYAPGCFRRNTIAAVYDYAFTQIKATRITARTARNNKRMLRLLPRLGFTWEGVAKRYYGPARRQDAILFALFPEDAQKWMTNVRYTRSAPAA